MIVTSPLQLVFRDVFYRLDDLIESCPVFLKLEGFSITGSIKIKTAIGLIESLERQYVARPGHTTIIESSSGNLGVALSLICKCRGYRFICVSDPNITSQNARLIRAYGAQLVIVDTRDVRGGYLATRIKYIQDLVSGSPDHIWLNQYANPANALAHVETGQEILNEFPRVDFLFIGTGTTGTIMGVAQRFRQESFHTRIVAVEPEGSITFDDDQKGSRRIPGIGTSRRPELLDPSVVDDVVWVSELDTIRMCKRLLRDQSLLIGGSTGSVLSAISQYGRSIPAGSVVVAISPDLGEKYLETVYSDDWVSQNY